MSVLPQGGHPTGAHMPLAVQPDAKGRPVLYAALKTGGVQIFARERQFRHAGNAPAVELVGVAHQRGIPGAAQRNRPPARKHHAIGAGLRPTNHTDFFVAPLDQLFMMWSAVNRISRAGNEVGPDQRISPLEALKTQTLWAAEQYDEGHRRGSLEVGKIADLVILDGNPLEGDPDAIRNIRIMETIKDGNSIFRH